MNDAPAFLPDVSVVLPMFNEEAVVERSLAVVGQQLQGTGRPYEIVCVDDGSRDRTLELLQQAAARDPRVVPVALSRNFGKEAAVAAGMRAARGRSVLFMDADLQHPPDVIPRMIELWDQGYDVINGVKEQRGRESLLYKLFAYLFNKLMGGASGAQFRGASDFKLLDRQVVEQLNELPEYNRFFRGLVAWVGFRTANVAFKVADRVAGETKWSVMGLVRYSLRNLVSFTAVPLRLIAGTGFLTLLFALVLGIQTVVRYARGEALTGFTTVILLQVILNGILLVSVGILAMYVAAIYDETKRRPLFVVRRKQRERDVVESRG